MKTILMYSVLLASYMPGWAPLGCEVGWWFCVCVCGGIPFQKRRASRLRSISICRFDCCTPSNLCGNNLRLSSCSNTPHFQNGFSKTNAASFTDCYEYFFCTTRICEAKDNVPPAKHNIILAYMDTGWL